MTQEKFQQAIDLFKAGNRKQVSGLLLEVVKSDSGNAEAWFGLALCTDVTEKLHACPWQFPACQGSIRQVIARRP
jgi:thioredoxin-like negative regulator of GroEL